MNINFKNQMLYINNVEVSKDLVLSDIDSMVGGNWEIWDFGNLFSRRVVFEIESEKIILVINFNTDDSKIAYWSIVPWNLMYKEKKIIGWVKRTFDLSVPFEDEKKQIKIFIQKNIHEGFFKLVGSFRGAR